MDLAQWWKENKQGIPFPGYDFLKGQDWLGDEKLGQIVYDEEKGFSINGKNWLKPAEQKAETAEDDASEMVSILVSSLNDIKELIEMVLEYITDLTGGSSPNVDGNTAKEKEFF